MKKYTDTELLDFLQLLTNRANYSGRVVMRESYTGRGWRLHESTHPDSVTDVREAISKFFPDGCDITALECPNCGRLNSSKRE